MKITENDKKVLEVLVDAKELMSARQVCEGLGLPKEKSMDVAYVLGEMIAEGLVASYPPNKSGVGYQITEQGKNLLAGPSLN